MGLDMYLYSVDKISEDDVRHFNGLNTSSLPQGYRFYVKEEFDANAETKLDLLPFLTTIKMKTSIFNFTKARFDHNIEASDAIVGIMNSVDFATWMFASGKELTLSNDEYQRYVDDELVDVYVLKFEQLMYWRNEYELNEEVADTRMLIKIRDLYDRGITRPTNEQLADAVIENAGVYVLTDEEKKCLLSSLAANCHYVANEKVLERIADTKNLCYHAWW